MTKALWMVMCYTGNYDGNKVAGIYTSRKKAQNEKIKLICGYFEINVDEYDAGIHIMPSDEHYEIEEIKLNETYISY